MKSKKVDFNRTVLIDRAYWDVPVKVHLRPYVQFCRQIDGQLSKLVARWAPAAAPNAPTLRRRMR
jgi:hypothetical protein